MAPLFLGLAVLALIIPFLHQGQKRRHLRVSSLVLWRQLDALRGRARAQPRRPRLTVPMVLQIVALLLIVLALARPVVGADPTRPAHTIYVLDASAAMQAEDGHGTRFEAATARLAALLRADVDPDGPRVSLVVASPLPEIIVARQRADHDLLAAVQSRLMVTDGDADWRSVERLVDSVRQPGEADRLVLLTSGDPGPKWPADLPVTALRFGGPLANAALEARLSSSGDGASPMKLTGTVRFAGGARQTQLAVDFWSSGAAVPLRLASTGVKAPAAEAGSAFTLDVPAVGRGAVSAHLDGDGNPSDDAAWFVTNGKPAPFDILLVGPARPALVQALKALDGAVLRQAAALPADTAGYGLVVVSDAVVDRPPDTNTLWLGQAHVSGTPAPPSVVPGDVTAWRADHPLSRGIVWSGLTVPRATKFVPWSDGDIVVAAGDTPLIEARSSASGREVRMAFDPTLDWAAHTSFPQVLDSLVDWLGVAPGRVVQAPCTVGVPCPIDARWFGKHLSRIGQDAKVALPPPGGIFVPLQAGLFGLDGDPKDALLAINPDTRVDRDTTTPASIATASDGAPPLRLWPWLLVCAGVALGLEMAVAVRRRAAPRWLGPVRAVVALLLGAAFFNLPAPRLAKSDQTVVVAAAPLVGGAGPGQADTATRLADGAEAGVVTVGDTVRVTRDFGAPGSAPRPTAAPFGSTAAAIRLAAAMSPDRPRTRLIVDGALPLSRSDVSDLLPNLRARGVTVDVAGAPPRADLVMADVEAPAPVFVGDSVTLIGRIRSNRAMPAHLKVTADGAPVAEQDLSLAEGDNAVDITVPHAREGDVLYEMEVSADAESPAPNKRNGVRVTARAKPRILILSAGQTGRDMADLLASNGLDSKVAVPTGAPWLIEDWLAYDGFMFIDVPALTLSSIQQDLVVNAVAQHGRPLLLFGGSHSFGPGGYLETALDRLSPLSSRVPKPSPESAVVFVIDRSGSMAQAVGDVDRLEIAKQATLSAMGLLNPQSEISIVAFDTEARLVAPLQSVKQAGAIRAALARMAPGGGTDLLPALAMAFDQLRGATASVKHVIVMTDGLTVPHDFDPLINEMRTAGITISTVAIGVGPDSLMRNIATTSGGAYYATNDFKALPSILSQETMLLSDSAVEERSTDPFWAGPRPPFLSGLPSAMPAVDGYVLTTAKADASVPLKVKTADAGEAPLLGFWQFGSGKVLALTTQVGGPWTKAWRDVPNFGTVWPDVLRTFLSGADASGLAVRLDRRQDRLLVAATALDKARHAREQLSLKATFTGGSIAPEPIPLHETQPGTYEGSIPLTAVGDYRVDVADGDKTQSATFHVAFPMRLAFDPPATPALTAATGGRVLPPAAALPQSQLQIAWTPNWIVWALAALVVFLGELVARYGGSLVQAVTIVRRAARPRLRSA